VREAIPRAREREDTGERERLAAAGGGWREVGKWGRRERAEGGDPHTHTHLYI